MSTTYTQKQSPAQKKDAPSASSVLDASSQGESLQRKADLTNNAAQRAEAPRPNNTGMPDNLKSGIESLSGFSMDDVRVHYNSSKPATVQALAYTQGTDIHVAPGQEKHLPHEAWHVAQQMAGRVSPTTNINGMPVNDNAALEHEADVMGEKAVTQRMVERKSPLKMQKNKELCSQLFFDDDIYSQGEGLFFSSCFLKSSIAHANWKLLHCLSKDSLKKSLFIYARVIKGLVNYLNNYERENVTDQSFTQGFIAIKKVRDKIKRFIIEEEQKKGIKPETNEHFQKMCDSAIDLCRNVCDNNLSIYFGDGKIKKAKWNYKLIMQYLHIVKDNNMYVNTYIGNLQFIDGDNPCFYAYVKPKQIEGKNLGKIRLKQIYRTAKEFGSLSKPGMLIHEVSHLAINTEDLAYGNDACLMLSDDEAIKNADSYRLAAEETVLPPPLPPRTSKYQPHEEQSSTPPPLPPRNSVSIKP